MAASVSPNLKRFQLMNDRWFISLGISYAIRHFHVSPSPTFGRRKAVVWTRFDQENDQIYGPIINSESNESTDCNESSIVNEKISKTRRLTSIQSQLNDYLEVLPTTLTDNEKLLNFPLINPWRARKTNGKKIIEESTSEEELFFRRKAILDQNELRSNEFPSVTKIIGATMPASSRQALESWKSRMIAELGEQKFQEYQQKVFRRGHFLHVNIARRLEEKFDEVVVNEEISGYWKSLAHVFTHITDVKLLEKPVSHPFLCYKGIIDCVAHYQKNLYLIDWKTSSRSKPTMYHLYDEPLQVIAYLGALNYDSNYDYQVSRAAIVVAYENGSPAHVHRIPETLCKTFWVSWVKRLNQYWAATGTKSKSQDKSPSIPPLLASQA